MSVEVAPPEVPSPPAAPEVAAPPVVSEAPAEAPPVAQPSSE